MSITPIEPQSSDEELVLRIRSAETRDERERAATLLLERYRARIFVWCLRYRPNREEALDLTQEILIKTYRGLASFQGRSRFSSWVFAVTRNECLKSLRGSASLESVAIDPDLLPCQAADPERQLLEQLAEQDMLDLIRDTLEPVERQALWMRCFDRLPVASITELLKIRDNTGARAVLQKARRKLRAALEARDRKEA